MILGKISLKVSKRTDDVPWKRTKFVAAFLQAMKCVTFDGITLSDAESRHNTMNSIKIVTASPAGIVNKYKNMRDYHGPRKYRNM